MSRQMLKRARKRAIPRENFGKSALFSLLCLLFGPLPSRVYHLLRTQSYCTMDPESRKTASAYINNLLLSRGLLRNGTPIDFATPKETEGGVDAAMSQVMNLVHDLILRRDVSQKSQGPFAGLFNA